MNRKILFSGTNPEVCTWKQDYLQSKNIYMDTLSFTESLLKTMVFIVFWMTSSHQMKYHEINVQSYALMM